MARGFNLLTFALFALFIAILVVAVKGSEASGEQTTVEESVPQIQEKAVVEKPKYDFPPILPRSAYANTKHEDDDCELSKNGWKYGHHSHKGDEHHHSSTKHSSKKSTKTTKHTSKHTHTTMKTSTTCVPVTRTFTSTDLSGTAGRGGGITSTGTTVVACETHMTVRKFR